MNERIYLLQEADPQVFFGVNNRNLLLLKETHPKLRIMARGNIIKVIGEPGELKAFLRLLNQMEEHATKFNSLTESSIEAMIAGEASRDEASSEGVIGLPPAP